MVVVFNRSSAAFKTFEDKMENLKVGSFVCCVSGWLLWSAEGCWELTASEFND